MKEILVIFLMAMFSTTFAQNYTQTIRGKVVDIDSKAAIIGATIVLLGSNPLVGTASDVEGNFVLEKIPIGRYNIQINFLGYKPSVIPEVLVTTGKEVFIHAELKEDIVVTQDVVIVANSEKDKTQNSMAIISARSFTVEESRRYAGSADDPMRAVTNFAGVAGSADVNSNGIIVRGNSPKGLLWKVDGVDIPNPNHYARIGQTGGGITVFSSQVLANSDFYTAAFPAEYGNAQSGVFDMKFRNGNRYKREYAFQIGIQGIDFATEGYFIKGKPASYLVNYRYSILGFLQYIDPDMKNKVPSYQDLSFKINIPTQGAGTFSLFGIGGISVSKYYPDEDSTSWKTNEEIQRSSLNTNMGALGLSHNYIFNNKTYTRTTFSITGNKISYEMGYIGSKYKITQTDEANSLNSKMSFSTLINHKFNAHHTNKTGFTINRLMFDVDIKALNPFSGEFMQYVKDNGNTSTMQVFTQSKFDIANNLILNMGLFVQYFGLNSNYSIEPRVGLRWNVTRNQAFSMGYGNHSQMEDVSVYLATRQNSSGQTIQPNKNLDYGKSHHFVFGYDNSFSRDLRLKIECYYQSLYHIPVIENTYYSMANNAGGYFNDALVNKGKGKNYGIDITFEKFLTDVFYYLATLSLFESKYTGGDLIERNGRYNAKYVANFLLGKEFKIKDKNILGVNLKTSFNGGEYYIPIDLMQSIAQKREVLDETQIYSKQFPDFYYVDLTLTYRINHKKYASTWAIQIKNVLNSKPLIGYTYDNFFKTIDNSYPLGIIPFISYKVEF